MLTNNIHLIAVTETNLSESVTDAEVSIGEWTVLRRDRRAGRSGGGVLLLSKPPIRLERVSQYETNNGEDLWAKFDLNGQCIYACVVYIPPNSKDEVYTEWFESVERVCSGHSSQKILIFGDLNMYSASQNSLDYYNNYFMTLCNFNEYNCVNNMNERMLDVVLAGVELGEGVSVRRANPEEELTSVDGHHPPLVIQIEYKFSKQVTYLEPSNIDESKDWNFARGDFHKLYCLVRDINWDFFYNLENTEVLINFFNTTLYSIFDRCIPKKIRTQSRTRTYPVYYTKDIISNIKLKAQLHKEWKRTRNEVFYSDFKALRSKIKFEVAQAHKDYSKLISIKIRANPSQFWQYVNSLRSRGGLETKVTRGSKEFRGVGAAEAFAEHFQSVFLPNRPSLDPSEASSKAPADHRRVDIRSISTRDVRRAIAKLKADTSAGPDAIPAYVLKGCVEELIDQITFIFNTIVRTGKYPNVWKTSRVTPIPKKGSKVRVENYRPVAILCALAKVFEMVLHDHLMPQCRPYITSSQHAFLPKRSVATNLVEMVDFLSKEMDTGNQVDVVYLDFQKAFDRVDNDVLLLKLGKMGFVPRLLKLFSSYLFERQQFVKYGPYTSNAYTTLSGISQGSNLGPFLFLILINDLPDVICHSHVMIFADDVKLIKVIRTEDDCKKLQQDIDAVHEWSLQNKLHFNPDKCEMMSFTRSTAPIVLQYAMADSSISRASAVRDLGVLFEPQLSFRNHACNVRNAALQRLGFVLRNGAFLTDAALRTLYEALVRSVLETNSVVWSPHEKKYILMLEQVQKKFLRYMYKKKYHFYPYLYPTRFLQGCLGFESVELRRKLALAKFVLQIIRNEMDSTQILTSIMKLNVPNRYLRGRYHRLLVSPSTRTESRRYSPVVRATNLLNSMLAAAPHCDLFADKIVCVMDECKRMLDE